VKKSVTIFVSARALSADSNGNEFSFTSRMRVKRYEQYQRGASSSLLTVEQWTFNHLSVMYVCMCCRGRQVLDRVSLWLYELGRQVVYRLI